MLRNERLLTLSQKSVNKTASSNTLLFYKLNDKGSSPTIWFHVMLFKNIKKATLKKIIKIWINAKIKIT